MDLKFNMGTKVIDVHKKIVIDGYNSKFEDSPVLLVYAVRDKWVDGEPNSRILTHYDPYDLIDHFHPGDHYTLYVRYVSY